jgi:trimeric autotransporter adhesin
MFPFLCCPETKVRFSQEKSLMKLPIACALVAFLSLVLSPTQPAVAQTSAPTASALPRLVRFSGTAKDLNGNPSTGVVGITFALYSEQTAGAPLWLETQNATADSSGHYTVLLGSTRPEGLPADLFTTEQAHWVGVQVSGQAEQPRVLLVSVPYALKAGDAETIGGLPPSAFVLAAPVIGSAAAGSSGPAEMATPLAATDVTTTGGTLGYIPIFSGADTIVDSVVFQSATSPFKIGINTTTPATALDVNGAGTIRGTLILPATGVATAAGGRISQGLNLTASSFSSTSVAAVNQTFRWLAEPAANDTTAPSGTMNLQYGLGTATPTETGLKVSSKGLVTFATGQTFPGTGDGSVTSVASGLGLKGGPITKTGTLTIDTTVVPQLAVANSFKADQTITGSNTAEILNVTQNGTGLASSVLVASPEGLPPRRAQAF